MFDATVVKILVASPSDLREERKVIPDLIHAWNAEHAEERGIVLLPVLWETHSTPDLGDRPQAIVNRQVVDGCDVLLGAFWTRLGTPTGEARSGTVEEIERFRSAGKRVILLFSKRPVAQDSVDPEQWADLKQFRTEMKDAGLVDEYNELSELRSRLPRYLTGIARDFSQGGVGSSVGQAWLSALKELDEPEDHDVALQRFQAELRRIGAQWAAERDSGPHNLDEGKWILQRLADAVLDFRGDLGDAATGEQSEAIGEVLRSLRELDRHQLYIDGGTSFREFWERGDQVLERAEALGSEAGGEAPHRSQ